MLNSCFHSYIPSIVANILVVMVIFNLLNIVLSQIQNPKKWLTLARKKKKERQQMLSEINNPLEYSFTAVKG